jgi:hypothetical protein
MGKFFSSAISWVILLLLLLIALLMALLFGWIGGGSSSPSPSGTATPTPTATGTATPASFVARPVTTGAYVPSASALTEGVLSSSGSGWVVAIDDTTQIDTSVTPHTETPGDRVLYLISPAGDRYELANLDTLGFSAPDLVAWDASRDAVLLTDAGTTFEVFDMAGYSVTSTFTLCSGYTWVHSGGTLGGNWIIRGGCDGEGFDGLYSDAGVLLPSPIIMPVAYQTIWDVGQVQFQAEFEMGPDERFTAFYPDGTSATIPSSYAGDCYALDKGRGQTMAVYCYPLDSAGGVTLWELPVDGSPGAQIVTTAQLDDFAMAAAAAGPGEYDVMGYCADSALRIIQFRFSDTDHRLGVLYGGEIQQVGQVPFRYRECHATSGTAALVGGDGYLWWEDFDTGTDIVMLPGGSAGSPIQVVGSDGYRALRQP